VVAGPPDQEMLIEVHRQIEELHRSSTCPTCGKVGPIDVQHAYWVWSAIVLTRWGSKSKLECLSCARPRRVNAIVSSLLLGWWGIPFGLIITPLQLVRNLAALNRSDAVPSAEFEELVFQRVLDRVQAQRAGMGNRTTNGAA
jgi:hypothetical protein